MFALAAGRRAARASRWKKSRRPRPRRSRLSPLRPQTVEGVVAATGIVAAAPGADWTITAPEPARIVELPKAEGDRVKPGDLLVRFEIPSLATDVATRRAEVETGTRARGERPGLGDAPDDARRARRRGAEGARGRQARARRSARRARASRQREPERRRRLPSRTVVRARFAGVIAKRAHNPGDMVEASAIGRHPARHRSGKLQVVAAVPIPDLRRVASRPARFAFSCRAADEPEDRQGAHPSGRGRPDRRRRRRAHRRSPARHASPPARRCASRSSPSSAPTRSRCPPKRSLHEDEDAFVMVAGADNKAHKRKVDARPDDAQASGDHRRPQGGRGGHRPGPAGPARRRGHHAVDEMSLVVARRALRPRHPHRHGACWRPPACCPAFSLPSDIYPPLDLPARRGRSATAARCPARTMMLTVTRPIEQALLEVPGVRRVRSTTFRGATEISAQFDPATDMVLALQQAQGKVAEIRGELPADLDLVDRAADAGGLSLSQRQPDGRPAVGRSLRLRLLRDAAGAVARARRRQRRSAVERHARDRGHRRSRAADRRRASPSATSPTRSRRRTSCSRSAAITPADCSTSCSRPGMWKSIDDIPRDAARGQGRRDDPRRRRRDGAAAARPIARRSSAATGMVAANISVSQQIGANILDVRAGVETALHGSRADAAGGSASCRRPTTSRSSSPPRSPTCATRSSSAACSR